jgi:RHS repeat-associated protein
VVAGTRAALIPDIQGSVIASLDSGSGSLSKIGYLPYGKSASSGPFGFTGQRIDLETNGLYYYRARHYSPAWGRFLQVDPIGTQGGINLYAYVGNDPLNFTDPNGLVKDALQTPVPNYDQDTGLQYGTVTLGQKLLPYAISVGATAALFGGEAALPALAPAAGGAAPELEATALNAARITGNAAQASGASSGAAGSIVTAEGTVFTDVSTGVASRTAALNPSVSQVLSEQIGTAYESKFAGGCAEVGCLSQLLNAGANPEGAVSVVVKIRGIGNPGNGQIIPACPSCANLLSRFGVEY